MLKKLTIIMAAFILSAGTAGLFAQDDGDQPAQRPNRRNPQAQRQRGQRNRRPDDRQRSRLDFRGRREEMLKQMESRKAWVAQLQQALKAGEREKMGKLIDQMDKTVKEEMKQQKKQEEQMAQRRKKFEERLKKDHPERYEAYMKQMKQRQQRRRARDANEPKDANDPNDPNTPERRRSRDRQMRPIDFHQWYGQVKKAYKAEDNKKLGKLIGKWQKQQEELEKRMQQLRQRNRERQPGQRPESRDRGERQRNRDRSERPQRQRPNRNADN